LHGVYGATQKLLRVHIIGERDAIRRIEHRHPESLHGGAYFVAIAA
jgi:hypothetical protein